VPFGIFKLRLVFLATKPATWKIIVKVACESRRLGPSVVFRKECQQSLSRSVTHAKSFIAQIEALGGPFLMLCRWQGYAAKPAVRGNQNASNPSIHSRRSKPNGTMLSEAIKRERSDK
jgi:hypothetical protein